MIPADLAETGSPFSAVTHYVVDHDLDGNIGEGLIAERVGPPQGRVGNVDAPLDLVLT